MNSLPRESACFFDKRVAKILGTNEAIVLYQLEYWMNINKEANRNFHNGMYWSYNTYEAWAEDIMTMSATTVKRVFTKLEKLNLVFSTKEYNQKKYDNTKWYTINYPELAKALAELSQNEKASGQSDQRVNEEEEKASGQNDQTIWSDWPDNQVNMTRPIPEITSKTTTENNQMIIEEEEEEALASQNLKFKSEFTDIEIQKAKRFINSKMYEEKNELNLSDEHFNRLICYMTMGGMKYISASEFRKKNQEIERNDGKDGKGRPITDRVFYIVKGISMSKRLTKNADREAYQLEKAFKEMKEEALKTGRYEAVEQDEYGNVLLLPTAETVAMREKHLRDIENGTVKYDETDDIPKVPFYNWLEEK